MGKIYESKITDFSGGMSEDKRVQDASKFSLAKHFDIFSFAHKLVPQYKTAQLTGEDKSLKITKFIYAPAGYYGAGEYRLFGFGADATDKARIFPYTASAWVTNFSGTGASARNLKVFFYYKDYLYFFNATHLSRVDVAVAGTLTDSYQGPYTTGFNVAEPVHHPSDDCAYFFTDNLVHKLNDVTWSGSVLTLPDDLKIVSACPFGNYLAIGCVSLDTPNYKSVVYLWDRDSSLATLSERIDFGSGEIKHLVCLDNKLIAVMVNNDGHVLIKQASGVFALTLKEIRNENPVTTDLPDTRIVKDNKLYFPMKATLNGDTRLGIWVTDSLGRTSVAYVEEEATSYQGIYFNGNLLYIAHSDDYSTNILSFGSFSSTLASVYESLILNGGDSSKKKKLIGVTVFTEPLSAAGQVVLKYRKDEETAWTTIFTHNTDNSISHSAINIETTGVNLPEFKELQFQINSTGGAVITGFKFKYEEIDKDLY